MKYNHKVKHNGKIYPAGADVPVHGKGANDGADTDNVEAMVARINELDNVVMERNAEIRSLQEDNEALQARVEELEAAIPSENEDDEKSKDGKSNVKPGEKPERQKNAATDKG